MSESSPVSTISAWVNTYQPVDQTDDKLLRLFRKLYQFTENSKAQKRFAGLIWQEVLPNLIANYKYIEQDSKHKKVHPYVDFEELVVEAYTWLTKPKIVVTNDLRQWLEHYCNTNDNNITQKLPKHLTDFKNSTTVSREHRDAERLIGDWTKKLIRELEKTNSPLFQELDSKSQSFPRVGFINPDQYSLRRTLTNWINAHTNQRIKDLEQAYREAPDSLNISVSNQLQGDDKGEEKIDQVVQNFQDFSSNESLPTFNSLSKGDLTNNLSNQEYSDLLIEIKNYFQNDPHELLVSRHIPGIPACNYKVLAKRLILQDKPDSIWSIAEEFEIATEEEKEKRKKDKENEEKGLYKDQKLYSQVSRNFFPFVAGIPLYLGYASEEIRQAIKHDPHGSLTKIRGNPASCKACTTQLLAQSLLPMFVPHADIFATVVQHLREKGHSVKATTIFPYQQSSFTVFKMIAEAVNEQLEEQNKISSYEVQIYWETATIKAIVAELQTECKKLTPEKVKKFWQEKCLIRLGRLAIAIKKEQSKNKK